MSEALARKRKWRPGVRSVVAAILIAAMVMPLVGLFFFRVYENQLIREAEAELIAQSAALAAAYRQNFADAGMTPDARTPEVAAPYRPNPGDRFHQIEPSLDLATGYILPRRPDARPGPAMPWPDYAALGRRMESLIFETQDITLAGFRILDPAGTVIAGRDETGLSLAHVDEVAQALKGGFAPQLRIRVSDQPAPPVYSVSRGTKVRVFTAMPVTLDGRVIGVVYASRTPSNIVRHFYSERGKLVAAALTVLAFTALLGMVVVRAISGPLQELTARTRRIEDGDPAAFAPLSHHGTREMAELSDAFLSMASRLKRRSDNIESFAAHVSHELKSPLTAIQGAAELLADSGSEMTDTQRRTFLDNIIADSGRLALLVRRLQDLARAENTPADRGPALLSEAVAGLAARGGIPVALDDPAHLAVAMARDNLAAILSNLHDNAGHHGATGLDIAARAAGTMAEISVTDDGAGISPGNRERIFDPFFTTRRDSGGTGMGLGIVRAIIVNHGGTISLAPSSSGTRFVVTLPLA